MIKIGLIDYYLDQYHAENYPKWIREASNGKCQAVYAWAQIDSPTGKPNSVCAREMGVELLPSPEEVIEKSDCLIVMAPDHPNTHEALCRLPLASGKPTYVDKTFAPDTASARRILDHARTHGTPMFSTSALRYAAEYSTLEREEIEFISSRGPGNFENYGIHQVEPIVCLMGSDAEKIMYTGTSVTPSFVLRYKDGRCATMSYFGWACDFSLALNYRDDHAVVTQGASDFYERFILKLIEFFETGVPPLPQEEILQVMEILEAGHMAAKRPDEWINIKG